MAHVPRTTIHGFTKRAIVITVDVDTALTPGDLTGVTFAVTGSSGDAMTKTGLTPTSGGSGIEIEVSLTAADLAIAAGIYSWECRATVGGQLVPLAAGLFRLALEPTVIA